jgi:hypothetical protein
MIGDRAVDGIVGGLKRAQHVRFDERAGGIEIGVQVERRDERLDGV